MPPTGMVVTGGDGRLARAIGAVAPDASLLTRQDLDVTDLNMADEVLGRLRPRVVINTAALADVDFCETHADEADRVNGAAPGLLAEACRRHGARLVHISTDYVFGAGPGGPYAETASANPIGVYGRSKAEGEAQVLAAGGTACVARVAWLFGHPHDFLHQMFARHLRAEPLRVFDQMGSPTPLALAALAVARVARRLAANEPTPSIVHLAGGPPASRSDWFGAALQAFCQGQDIATPEIGIIPVPASRPRDSALDSSLAAALLGLDFGWRNAAVRLGESMIPRPSSASAGPSAELE